MLHDKAFDNGIITIAEDMTISVSREYAANADHFFKSALLSCNGKLIALSEKFHPHREFLDYHRQYVFKA
jgi:predicted restriction endonuclease